MTLVESSSVGSVTDGSLCSVAVAPKDHPVRVLQVVTQVAMGGTEMALLSVMAGLNDGRFQQGICAVRRWDSNMPVPVSVGASVFVASGRKGRELSLLRLMRAIKQFKPDIVHSRNWGSIEAIPAARLAGVRAVVHSEHGYELDILQGLPLRRRLLRRAVYGMADAVFTVSRDLRDYHARQAWFPADRIRVINNGVDITRFKPRLEVRRLTRERLKLPQESLLVGSIGRLVPIKDHHTLLRAAEIMLRRGMAVDILLGGSGPELERLKDYATRSCELQGRVHIVMAGFEIVDLLNAMDIFVLPSVCEGMSNTLLEAMACGLPVLATSTGGTPEVLQEGRTGWLFRPGDARALALGLENLAANLELRRQFGEAGRLRVVEQFSINRMVEQYRNLYFELASRSRALPQGEPDVRN
jgi:sugar transferase (PEP-CTERM/EpsH1 system associated)